MEVNKTHPYGKFYLVRSSAGDMYYRTADEARQFGLPTEVWGFPVCNAADRLCKLPLALYGSEAERQAAYDCSATVRETNVRPESAWWMAGIRSVAMRGLTT